MRPLNMVPEPLRNTHLLWRKTQNLWRNTQFYSNISSMNPFSNSWCISRGMCTFSQNQFMMIKGLGITVWNFRVNDRYNGTLKKYNGTLTKKCSVIALAGECSVQAIYEQIRWVFRWGYGTVLKFAREIFYKTENLTIENHNPAQ